jgi:protease-4
MLTIAGDYLKPRTADWGKGTLRVGAQANFLKGLVLTGAYQTNLGDALPAAGGLPFKDLVSVGVNFQYGNSENEFAGLFGDGGVTGVLVSSNFSAEKKDFFSLFGIGQKEIAELSVGGSLDDVRQSGFLGLDAQPSIHDYIRALDKAAEDETIGGVLLNIYPMAGSGLTDFSGIVQELAAAVERVRTAGKRVVAYLPEGGGAAELYVASYAETVVAPREAAVGGYGVSISLLRMRDFFKKYGIDWEVNAAGDYKTTFQTMFTDSTTPVQRREIEELVSSQYTQLIARLEKGRNITLTEQQKKMLSGIITTDRAVEMKIIDFTGFKDRAKRELHSMVRGNSEEDYGTVNIFAQKKWNGEWGIRPQIAVVHVEGSIVTGESSGGGAIPFFSSGASTGSETFTRQIRSAMYDRNIKAIVVRVNSGGGSALASDMMYAAIQKAIEKKPVIISFGDVAASGGYYLAVASNKIFANPATITGSIGVISSKPVVARLLDTLHINEETFKEGEHSDMGTIYRHYTPEENAMVEEYVNSTYQEFLNKVAKGRNISKEHAGELGGGRVYTGEQAQRQKLVDEFGGLFEAVREAKNQAELDDNRYDVVFYSANNEPALQDIFLEAALNGMMSGLGLSDFPFLKSDGEMIK